MRFSARGLFTFRFAFRLTVRLTVRALFFSRVFFCFRAPFTSPYAGIATFPALADPSLRTQARSFAGGHPPALNHHRMPGSSVHRSSNHFAPRHVS